MNIVSIHIVQKTFYVHKMQKLAVAFGISNAFGLTGLKVFQASKRYPFCDLCGGLAILGGGFKRSFNLTLLGEMIQFD